MMFRDTGKRAGRSSRWHRCFQALIVFVLTLSMLAGCGDDADESTGRSGSSKKKSAKTEITAQGTWTLDSMTTGGTSYAREDLEEVGFTATLELKKNGKGTLTMNGEESSVTWDKKSVTINGVSSEIVSLDEDTMEISDDGADMTWTRGTSAASAKKKGSSDDEKTDGTSAGSSDKTGKSKEGSGKNKNTGKKTASIDQKVRVTPTEAAGVSWETYQDAYVSFKYPKGWKKSVELVGTYEVSITIFSPSGDGIFFYATDLGPIWETSAIQAEIDSWESIRQMYAQTGLYPEMQQQCADAIAQYRAIPTVSRPVTTEKFYETLGKVVASNENEISRRANRLFTDIEALDRGNPLPGVEIIYCKMGPKNDRYEGYLLSGIMDYSVLFGSSPGVWIAAPEAKFGEYNDTLCKIFDSIVFTDTYWQVRRNGKNEEAKQGRIITDTMNEISDMQMDVWRNQSETQYRVTQKWDDTIMEYERVYDTETGEIYRAQTGFMDEYELGNGTRYQPITDEQYADGYVGYIDWK